MDISILSRKEMISLLKDGFPQNVSVISFYDPRKQNRCEELRVDLTADCGAVFFVPIPDIDLEILGDFGYTYETYLSEANELARFIYEAKNQGRRIICQCNYGQSRSAACAAAILQHFEHRGIEVFADYRYYPNQLVYHKIFDALEEYAVGQESKKHKRTNVDRCTRM